MFKSFLLKKV